MLGVILKESTLRGYAIIGTVLIKSLQFLRTEFQANVYGPRKDHVIITLIGNICGEREKKEVRQYRECVCVPPSDSLLLYPLKEYLLSTYYDVPGYVAVSKMDRGSAIWWGRLQAHKPEKTAGIKVLTEKQSRTMGQKIPSISKILSQELKRVVIKGIYTMQRGTNTKVYGRNKPDLSEQQSGPERGVEGRGIVLLPVVGARSCRSYYTRTRRWDFIINATENH